MCPSGQGCELVQVVNPTMPIARSDAIQVPIRDRSVQCVVTSPPYLGQRIYGDSELELGREPRVYDFVTLMGEFGEEMQRVLKPDGLLWLNLGDKANFSGGAGGDYNKGGSKNGKPKFGKFYDDEFEKTQFLDVPGKVIAELQSKGWRLRADIIWNRMQQSRESLKHVNRPRVQHERILMLAPGPGRSKFFPDRLPETGSIWSFPSAQAERKGHAAPFPDELPSRCVLTSTDPGDLVLDPFSGSHTTVRVATKLNRRAVGLDLYAGEST